jgi:CDP-paratose 2-epimerase
MKFLIFGGCGFLGSNLASEVAKRGEELVIFDNLSRTGSELNLKWLESQGKFQMIQSDIRESDQVTSIIKAYRPDVIFHTAGQVAMTTSLENPRLDFETNMVGTFNILEAIRLHSPSTAIFYSSTNKVYGDLEHFRYKETATRYICEEHPKGFSEALPLDFRTPYGCSKGAADQYIKDYSLSYGLKTVVFRHSSIYGGRQFSTADQGWIGWFVKLAIDTKKNKLKQPFNISGNGKQVRDVLFASDIVSCYFDAVDCLERTSGQIFNIGGGYENSLSLIELFKLCEEMLDIKMEYNCLPARQSDQKFFVADINKAEQFFNWKPQVDKNHGLKQMIEWVSSGAI